MAIPTIYLYKYFGSKHVIVCDSVIVYFIVLGLRFEFVWYVIFFTVIGEVEYLYLRIKGAYRKVFLRSDCEKNKTVLLKIA